MKMTHSKTKFNAKWMDQLDGKENLYKLWCRPSKSSPYEAACTLCSCNISVEYNGIRSLLAHSKTRKHEFRARANKTASSTFHLTQPTIKGMITKVAKDDTTRINEDGIPSTTAKVEINEYLNTQEQACKAEIRWALKCANNNYSFVSNDNISNIFQDMFPDSQIARNFKLGYTKTSFVIGHGLGPYFQ